MSQLEQRILQINLSEIIYRDGITNAGIYHIRTSILEGIKNKIKVLKRVAYGYRDLDYFFLRIRSAFRGKFTPIPTIG
ncbi:MAG: transposase [Succinivibrio sp.]|nr:transposase [Succinivibrio sp.]